MINGCYFPAALPHLAVFPPFKFATVLQHQFLQSKRWRQPEEMQ